MEQVQEKAAVGTWMLFKVALASLEIAPRHREAIFGVDDVERELVPAVEAFMAAAIALRTFEAKRKVTLALHDDNLALLRRRTNFWLTYVRINLPSYTANEVSGNLESAEVVIDRARGAVEVSRSYSEETAPRYTAPLLAELGPLYEQCLRERTLERDLALELQRLQESVRVLMVPAFRSVSMLRRLLRNALGSTHVDVRALNTDPPSKSKKAEEAAAKRKAAKEQAAKEKADKAAAKQASNDVENVEAPVTTETAKSDAA